MSAAPSGHNWIELDIAALGANLAAVRALLPAETRIVFVVKANAYGHGLAPVARAAWAHGVRWFAVAHLAEARVLRAVCPEARVLLTGVVQPADAEETARLGLYPLLVSEWHARELARHAAAAGLTLQGHLKVDTGMARLGVPWAVAADTARHLAAVPGLALHGICTHFAAAGRADRAVLDEQLARFRGVLADCATHGLTFAFRHVANSGALLREGACGFDGVRPGILLYGYGRQPFHDAATDLPTRPILQWRTRLVQVRTVPAGTPVSYDGLHVTSRATVLGTADVGYADGYPRLLTGKGEVVVGGRRCPVVGRVTMNMICLDLGPDAREREGDPVTLIGRDGAAAVWADELAAWAGTIPYEILTNIRCGVS